MIRYLLTRLSERRENMRINEAMFRECIGYTSIMVDRTPVPDTERKIQYTWIVRIHDTEVGRGISKRLDDAIRDAKNLAKSWQDSRVTHK